MEYTNFFLVQVKNLVALEIENFREFHNCLGHAFMRFLVFGDYNQNFKVDFVVLAREQKVSAEIVGYRLELDVLTFNLAQAVREDSTARSVIEAA